MKRTVGPMLAALGFLPGGAEPPPAAPPAAPLESTFLPALDHGRRTAAAWREEFARTGGASREALWSLFHWDDRSDATVDLLRRWQRLAPSSQARREIEVVLNHWGVRPDAPVPLPSGAGREFTEPDHLPLPGVPYAPPFPVLEGFDERVLLGHLAGDDPVARAAAAVTLVRSRRQLAHVVRHLVETLFVETRGTWYGEAPYANDSFPADEVTGLALRWCVDHAGSAADDALLTYALDPSLDDARRSFVLGQVGPSSAALPDVARGSLVELARLPGRPGELACRWAMRVAGVSSPGFEMTNWPDAFLDDPAGSSIRRPLSDPDAERMLAEVFAAFLAERRARGSCQPNDVWQSLRPALRSEAVARAVVRELLPWVLREDDVGDAAFQVACELGGDSPALRRRYVESLRRLDPRDGTAWIPRLRRHDGETIAALESAFDAAADKAPFVPALAAAGLLDAPWSRLGREACRAVGSNLRLEPWTPWGVLGGVRGVPDVAPTDPPVVQCAKRTTRLLTLREHGLDASQELVALERLAMDAPPEEGNASFVGTVAAAIRTVGIASPAFLDWAIDSLREPLPHAFLPYGDTLRRFALDARQQARLGQLDSIWGIGSHLALFAAQGEASIERVGEMRGLLVPVRSARHGTLEWPLDVLDAILAITRPTPDERNLLVRALEGGDAAHRRDALGVIARRRVASPDVLEAVRRCAADVDLGVRRAADAALRALDR